MNTKRFSPQKLQIKKKKKGLIHGIHVSLILFFKFFMVSKKKSLVLKAL